MVNEKFRQQAKVLTIDFIRFAIDFKQAVYVLPVDFSTRRMCPETLLQMPVQNPIRLHILETELADKYLIQLPDVFRIWRLEPALNFIVPEFDYLALFSIQLQIRRRIYDIARFCDDLFHFSRLNDTLLEQVQLKL